jgi:hypothetical protein
MTLDKKSTGSPAVLSCPNPSWAKGWRGGEASAPGTTRRPSTSPAGASMGASPPLARLTPLSPPGEGGQGEVRSGRTPQPVTGWFLDGRIRTLTGGSCLLSVLLLEQIKRFIM